MSVGTRDYNAFVSYFRQDSTEELLEDIKLDIYCITKMFTRIKVEKCSDWILIWNSYITLKANLDVLSERGVTSYSTKLAAEAILARLQNALDKCRTEGRESRLSRKLAKAQKR